MWELDYKESWTLKNWCFELWCWRRLWRVPWTARRSSQSILKEISPEYSLWDWCWSWNSNTLVIWFEELTHLKKTWCWERLMAGGEGDDRGWDGWIASPTQWTWVWVSSGSWWWSGKPGVLQSKGWQRVGHDWATELNWTEGIYMISTSYTHWYFFFGFLIIAVLVNMKYYLPYMLVTAVVLESKSLFFLCFLIRSRLFQLFLTSLQYKETIDFNNCTKL